MIDERRRASSTSTLDSVTVGPDQPVALDLEAKTVVHRGTRYALSIPEGARKQLLEGTWNATAVLLGAEDAIEATAAGLPYVGGFGG